jgi:hypothetical protein
MITIATLALSPDGGAAVWATSPVGRLSLTHTAAVVFTDIDGEYDLLERTIADNFLYAPTPDAADYARALGFRPVNIRNLREPAIDLQATVSLSHQNQVMSDPADWHPAPKMRPVPYAPVLPSSAPHAAAEIAAAAANYVLAVWQAWLDAECERAKRHRQIPGDTEGTTIRALPDEFILAERPVSMAF